MGTLSEFNIEGWGGTLIQLSYNATHQLSAHYDAGMNISNECSRYG